MHSCHETSGCIRCNDATSHKVSCHLHHRRWLHIPCRLEELCDSDHYPITISYGSTEISYAIPSWKLRKADWTSFSHEAREQLGCSNPGISLDEFSEKIIAIANNNIPASQPTVQLIVRCNYSFTFTACGRRLVRLGRSRRPNTS